MNGRKLLAEVGEASRIAVAGLLGNRLRSLLTTLGMVIGVATVIAIVGIIEGLDQSFERQVSSLGSHTLYVQTFEWLHEPDDWWKFRNRKPIGTRELDAIRERSTLATAAAPVTGAAAVVAHEDRELSGVRVTATTAAYLGTSGDTLVAGRFLVELDDVWARSVTVLGADVVSQLFPDRPPESVVGQRVRIGGRRFRVVGVLAPRGQLLGMPQDNFVVMPYSTFLPIYGKRRSLALAVAVTPGQLDALEDEIIGILRQARHVAPGEPNDFAINRQQQILDVYDKLTGALYGVAIGIGLITLLVGGIGIMNIMLVSVRERTREIGIRRAIGARRRTIVIQFLLESAAVAVLGGAIGTALGLGAAQLVAAVSPLAAAVTPRAVILGLTFSATVGILFGLWPAWRAAMLDPIEALRYE